MKFKAKKKEILFSVDNLVVVVCSTDNCKDSTENLICLFVFLIKFCTIETIFEDQKSTQLEFENKNNKNLKVEIEIANLKSFEKKKKKEEKKEEKKKQKSKFRIDFFDVN